MKKIKTSNLEESEPPKAKIHLIKEVPKASKVQVPGFLQNTLEQASLKNVTDEEKLPFDCNADKINDNRFTNFIKEAFKLVSQISSDKPEESRAKVFECLEQFYQITNSNINRKSFNSIELLLQVDIRTDKYEVRDLLQSRLKVFEPNLDHF